MQLVINTAALPAAILPPRMGLPRTIPANASVSDKKLLEMRVDQLREAVRDNQVSFPSQIPTFSKHTRPDLQQKLVQLYFICGWSGPKIRARYRLGAQRFQQILSTWKRRAVELGYIQTIPPDQSVAFSGLHFPIQVTLSPLTNGLNKGVANGSGPASLGAKRFDRLQQNNHHHKNGNGREIGRPRSKCDSSQIAEVLRHLQDGRNLAEIASEAGVTTSTVRLWKRQHEMRMLRGENRELRERLAKLGAIEKTERLR
jgi:hypothetical protein